MKKNREEKNEDFLKKLMSMTREEMTEFIRVKGKEPKLIKPFICLNSK